jgi:hypothetical protein
MVLLLLSANSSAPAVKVTRMMRSSQQELPVAHVRHERAQHVLGEDGRGRQQRAAGGGQDGRQQRAEEHDLRPHRHLAQHQVGQDALDGAASSALNSFGQVGSVTSAA